MVVEMDFGKEVARIKETAHTANVKRDVKSIINAIMESPVSDKLGKEVVHVDGKNGISWYKGKSLDVQTTLLLKITDTALKTGDVKTAEFLMKYGGYEPPKQQQVTLDLPTFINDMPSPMSRQVEETRDVPPSEKVSAILSSPLISLDEEPVEYDVSEKEDES